ncbi:MAG: outer membrane beta-barrel protein [Desulfuromonadaceae bacterium]|nr:outer membrane beta-barrel protein [Desulfuromonadaceae bacterium]
MATYVFELILIMLISAIFQAPAFSAEIIKSKPKPDPSGGLSVSSTSGYHIFDRSEHLNTQESYGIKIGYETIEKSIADSIGVEGTLNYFKVNSTSNPKIYPNSGNGYLIRFDATYPFPINKKWMPFIAIGAGGRMIEKYAGNNTNFLLNYGIGVKYFIQNYLALRIDARQLGIIDNSLINKNYEVSLGLSYYFGKERPKQPKALPAPEKKKIIVLEDVTVKKEPTIQNAAPSAGIAVAVPTLSVSEAPMVPSNNDIIRTLPIEFDKGSSTVNPGNFTAFQEIANALSGSVGVFAQIVLHTDVVTKPDTNIKLMDQRARSIRGNLLKLNVNPNQIIITTVGPKEPVVGNALHDGSNNQVDIQLVKMDEAVANLLVQQERQRDADLIAKERLEAETLAKSRIRASVTLQETQGRVPVDTDSSLLFEVSNQGLSTEEYSLTLVMPKEFDGILTRANRPDEKITYLLLAPGETFKGSALFRIPAGMADGQSTKVSVKVVSKKFNDVTFQKDTLVVASAPMVRVEAVLDKLEAAPGEKLNYHLTILNVGTIAARNLVIKVELPQLTDFISATGPKFTRDANGFVIFTISDIDSGKQSEINIVSKVRENSIKGQEMLWNAEVIEGSVQKRFRYPVRATIAPPK